MQRRPSVQIVLTPEQLKEAQQAINLKDCTQELTPEVLEERIAPAVNLNSSKSNTP